MNKFYWFFTYTCVFLAATVALYFLTWAKLLFPKSVDTSCQTKEWIVCDVNGTMFNDNCEAEAAGLSADKNEYSAEFCPTPETTQPGGGPDWITYSHEEMRFDYPTDWELKEEKIVTEFSNGTEWYRADFNNKNWSASLRYESNPDGYGPFGWNRVYTVTISDNGSVKVANTETFGPSEIPSQVLDYAVKLQQWEDSYLWHFTSDNADDEAIFQQFLKSIILKKTSQIGCTGETITSPGYAFCLPKNQTWKRENGQIDLTDTQTEDTISITQINWNSYTDKDSKFGDVTISFDAKSQTWKSSMPARVLTTSKWVQVFTGTRRWLTYIVPLSSDRIVILNSTGAGYTEPLKQLIETLVIEK